MTGRRSLSGSFWVFLLLWPSLSGAVSGERATSGASFLKLPAGSRALGLGGAAVASSRDADALFWNPAALPAPSSPRPANALPKGGRDARPPGSTARHSAVFSHVEYLESASVENGAYRYAAPWGGVGVGYRYASAGRLEETDFAGVGTGSFAPSDLAVSLGYGAVLGPWAGPLEGFSLGVAGKWIESRILTTASAWAADLGALSPVYLDRRLVFGASVRHLGTSLKFDSATETLPLEGRLGASFRSSRRLLLASDLAVPRDDDPFVALGAEYALASAKGWTVSARAGFNSRTVGDVRGFSGATFGLGWSLGWLGFDYGFEPMGSLGSPHHFTLTASF